MGELEFLGGEDVAAIVLRDDWLTFVWHGGAYIDVYAGSTDAPPVEVINVWDDEADISYLEMEAATLARRRPLITVLELFEARCRAFRAEVVASDAEVDA